MPEDSHEEAEREVVVLSYVKLRIPLRALLQDILLLGRLVGHGVGVSAAGWEDGLAEWQAGGLEGAEAGDHGHLVRRVMWWWQWM